MTNQEMGKFVREFLLCAASGAILHGSLMPRKECPVLRAASECGGRIGHDLRRTTGSVCRKGVL